MDRFSTNKFILASKARLLEGSSIDPASLHKQGLYKFLSLLEAARSGVKTPPTLLLLEWNEKAVKSVIDSWSLPLMIRLDYTVLPKNKNLGGIPLHTYQSVRSVCKSLISQNCYPMLHPHLDRFNNKYSVGILMAPGKADSLIEVVGEGFDASDIRLGSSLFHEIIKVDILRDLILESMSISKDDYRKERTFRITKINKLKQYIDYANTNGTLLPSLDVFKLSEKMPKGEISIPSEYNPIPKTYLSDLTRIAFTIWDKVLSTLPQSKEFVASLSFLEKTGWILWDIYGHWYAR